MAVGQEALDQDYFALMLAMDKMFEAKEELFRIVPATYWVQTDGATISHWHRHVSGRRLKLKQPVKTGNRLDASFLCGDVTYVLAKSKLRVPGLFFYLN